MRVKRTHFKYLGALLKMHRFILHFALPFLKVACLTDVRRVIMGPGIKSFHFLKEKKQEKGRYYL